MPLNTAEIMFSGLLWSWEVDRKQPTPFWINAIGKGAFLGLTCFYLLGVVPEPGPWSDAYEADRVSHDGAVNSL